MDASLDTDIVIHLYKSKKKDLQFSDFNKLFIYEYLFEKEMQSKSIDVYKEFKKDIHTGQVQLVTNADLIKMGIKGLFENYKESNKYLFDKGELLGIALAKAMGIAAFVTDDTKDRGPYHTLIEELIEGVIPFTFYELLFIRYLNSQISIDQMYNTFQEINNTSMSIPMNFPKKLSLTVKRFSRRYGRERDIEWIETYCHKKEIELKTKMQKLKAYLKSM